MLSRRNDADHIFMLMSMYDFSHYLRNVIQMNVDYYIRRCFVRSNLSLTLTARGNNIMELHKENALNNPPCPITPTLTLSSVHHSSH